MIYVNSLFLYEFITDFKYINNNSEFNLAENFDRIILNIMIIKQMFLSA